MDSTISQSGAPAEVITQDTGTNTAIGMPERHECSANGECLASQHRFCVIVLRKWTMYTADKN